MPDQDAPIRRPYLRVGKGRAAVAARLRVEYEAGASVVDLAGWHDLSGCR